MTETPAAATGMIGNGVVVTGGEHPQVIDDGAIVWRDGRIVAVGGRDDIRRQHPDLDFLDAHGGMILPGLVNVHHHFYSALARGLDARTPMRNFAEVLDRLWWRLDRALDEETVRVSADLSAAECIRHGTTTVFDHHASPSYLGGSLDLIAGALERAGLSALLCYEVTDRNGREEALAGIDENVRFVGNQLNHPRIRGVFGLHASFTLRDATLQAVADLRPEGSGCHIHVAEDPVDVDSSLACFGAGPVERLENFGLLDRRSLLAHAIHLDTAAYETIASHDAIILHNPESNANNGVGRLDVARVASHGCLVGLGTDGMSASMLRALRFAFLNHRGARRDPAAGFDALPHLLHNNARIARRFFDEPLLGELVVGAPADLIAVDAVAPTPLDADNLFGHLVYGISEYPVRHTVARGATLLQDYRHTTIDPAACAARAAKLSPALWGRFLSLDTGTPYLG